MLYKHGIAAGILPSIPYAEILTYTFSTAFLFHAVRKISLDRNYISPETYKELKRVTRVHSVRILSFTKYHIWQHKEFVRE